jgi:hypothetical protein
MTLAGLGEVAQCRDELNPEREPTPPMSVHALQHTEDFHPSKDMLNALPGLREYAVFLALVSGEGRRSRRLMGRDGVPIASSHTLMSTIPDQDRLVGKPHARLTE